MHGLSISLADQLYTLGDAHNYACVLVASHIGHMHVLFPPACFPRCRLRPMISLPSTTTTLRSMQQEPPANSSSSLPLLSTFSGGCTSCTAPIFSCKEYLQFLMSISPFRDLVIFTQPLSPDIPLSLKLSDGRWSSLPKIYLNSCRTGNRIQRHKHQYKLSQHSKGLSTWEIGCGPSAQILELKEANHVDKKHGSTPSNPNKTQQQRLAFRCTAGRQVSNFWTPVFCTCWLCWFVPGPLRRATLLFRQWLLHVTQLISPRCPCTSNHKPAETW